MTEPSSLFQVNHWYNAAPNEIFLDLDSARAIARALSVLRVAKLQKQLEIKSMWLYPTLQINHAHMVVVLYGPMADEIKVAWALWCGSDRLRASFSLMRSSLGLGYVDLFVSSRRYHRLANGFCCCKGKHKAKEVTDECPVLTAWLGEYRSADYFARTGKRPPRGKIRIPWGRVNQKQILKWKD